MGNAVDWDNLDLYSLEAGKIVLKGAANGKYTYDELVSRLKKRLPFY